MAPPHGCETPGVRRVRYYLEGTFLVEHRPHDGPVRDTAILILPPLGYEDISAYRPLRVLADALAGAGHVVSRLDWPGQGDSEGDATTPDLPAIQIAAASRVALALRSRGFQRVAAIGVRAGALLGLAGAGLDELVLWGTPASGKAWVREERAFHKLAARQYGSPPQDRPATPEGAVEAGGFCHSASTVAGMEALSGSRPRFPNIQRALLIPRDGGAAPAELAQALVDLGANVRTVSIRGLGDLLEDPYRSSLNPNIRAEILDWFARGEGTVAVEAPRVDTMRPAPGVVERPWTAAGGAGELSGVLCQPEAPGTTSGSPDSTGSASHWTLFLNAGGVRRVGPNRLWSVAARLLAAEGRPSLRFDVRDVGDSDGSAGPHTDLEQMYAETSVLDVVSAYDALRALGARRIDVVGLCSGAFLGVQLASRRPVARALLFNGLAYVWDDEARAAGVTSQLGRSLFDARRWRRLLSGRIDWRGIPLALYRQSKVRIGELRGRLRGEPASSAVDRILQTVLAGGTRLELVSSEGDPSITYLAHHVPESRRPPLTVIPAVDHTLRPVWAHPIVLNLIRGQA